MVNRRVVSLLAASLALGCSDGETLEPLTAPSEPPVTLPPESCDAPSVEAVKTFQVCSLGSGSFGRWIKDDFDLPAYEYMIDENVDPRASYFNTEGIDRRDHWHAFGNSRVNALFSNDGTIEVTTQDRGESYLNKYEEDQQNYAGGFGWLDDGTETWCTAYKWRPPGAKTRRVFGIDYAEATTEYRSIKTTRRTYAPDGDWPNVLADVTIENESNETRTLLHYEYWDVARRPIEIDWAVSGSAVTAAPEMAREARDARNGLFHEQVSYDPIMKLLSLRRALVDPPKVSSPVEPDPVDYFPGDPYLSAQIGAVTEAYTDQKSFFGSGGVAHPDAVARRVRGDALGGGPIGKVTGGLGQPRMFVLKSPMTLKPGEKAFLRFSFGYTPLGSDYFSSTTWTVPERDVLHEAQASLKKKLLYFSSDRDPFLQRELAWHSAQMEASVGYRQYWGVHVVPQGSAYLYLHGADGAARDLSLFSVPLVYTDPALASEELALNMMITYREDKRIAYAFQGHGVLDDALGFHKAPSDLTIFLLYALGEYVGATGDTAFLDRVVPYYPVQPGETATTWDHLVAAVRYLFDTVGTGPHGLLRIGDGDWSDGIVLEAPNHAAAVAMGESVPNTQMAVAILPRVADLVEPRDPALAAEIRAKIDALRAALASAWAGKFYGRAFFGDDNLAYADTINLESQVWALIGGETASVADRDALISGIRTDLDDPSPAGATLLKGGQVWPAISGLLTWGYARSSPEAAWKHFARNTMTAHAEAYPDVWYGIWSGPDGLNGPAADRPGETWYSPVTPMVDFPVMNNNQHAMPLLAAIRLAGVEATATGITLSPRVAGSHFSLATRLFDVAMLGDHVEGAYRPVGGALRTLDVVAPAGKTIVAASVDGMPAAVSPGATAVRMFVAPAPGLGKFSVDLSN